MLPEFVVVGIDPGIDIAGYSVIKHTVNPQNSLSQLSLLTVSAIKADLGTTNARVRFLCSEFENLINVTICEHKGMKVIAAIECPNEVLYGGVAARASNVIKLIAAAYGVIGRLTSILPVFTVRPTDWQPSKKSREIKDVKQWSRQIANAKLKAFRSTLPAFEKQTQDIADALNIGVCGYMKVMNGEWVL